MPTLQYRPFYQRHLPHCQPPGATFFISFRLADSIPLDILMQLEEESKRLAARLNQIQDPERRTIQVHTIDRILFGKWDKALASCKGPVWLKEPEIARIVSDSMCYLGQREFDLHGYCIMPNHVHLVCTPHEKSDGIYHSLASVLHSLKRYTARAANRLLDREGQFWQHESYDHVIRDGEEFKRIAAYVQNNPVAAGLVQNGQEWDWTYWSDGGG